METDESAQPVCEGLSFEEAFQEAFGKISLAHTKTDEARLFREGSARGNQRTAGGTAGQAIDPKAHFH